MAEHAHLIEQRRKGDVLSYDGDWSMWVHRQVALLSARRFDEVDMDNLLDEVSSLAARDFKRWVSAIRLVILHMLKWDRQPDRRTRSWLVTIVRERSEIEDGLSTSPSYAGRIDEALARAYPAARREAVAETGLPATTFPEACPYDWTEITTREHPLPGDDD